LLSARKLTNQIGAFSGILPRDGLDCRRHKWGKMGVEGRIEERMGMSKVTIYHNPQCGTSRNVLGLIRESGTEPEVIEYLETPPSREKLLELIEKMGLTVRDVLRRKGTPYDELGLDNPSLSDDQLLDAMVAHPILINRPIVVTPLGTKLCRPSETVLDILPQG
jgi:arsenate reductase